MTKKETKAKTKTPDLTLRIPSSTDDFIQFIIESESSKARFALYGLTDKGDMAYCVHGLTHIEMVAGLIDGLLQSFRKDRPQSTLTDNMILTLLFDSVTRSLGLTVIQRKV
jgi:hypothetical protein